MRIIRPYGRSAVRPARQRRILVERGAAGKEHDLGEFARACDELVIAQWISVIDKIATKPTGNRKPTKAQRDLRKRLGDAAWAYLVEKKLLSGLADKETRLEELWKFKVEPYPNGDFLPAKDRNGNPKPEPSSKGRWYARFAGDIEPGQLNAAGVVRKIHLHLYKTGYRIAGHRPNKWSGRISARAESIAGNILRRPGQNNDNPPWSEDDKEDYAAPGDVAATIHAKAVRMEKDRQQSVFMRDVGPVLFEHYGRLFRDDDGAPLPIKAARSRPRHRGIFALHEAVKEVYKRCLSGHKPIKHKSVAGALPADLHALFTLIDKTHANRSLSGFVRLGKVIHYEAAAAADHQGASGAAAEPAHVLGHWPQDVSQSRYWSSDGQADIKRNEAFVRVWRHVLALAARTLTDWADPQAKQENDILGEQQIQAVTGTKFCLESCHCKLDLLFGSHACFFKSDPAGGVPEGDFERRVLRFALEGIARLRNSAFHFKGLGGFARALEFALPDNLRGAITKLWTTDRDGRAGRLRETMRAAHFEYFFDNAQNQKLLDAIWQSVSNPGTADVPLPRFSRLLRRTSNIKDNASPSLPEPVNRSALEQPARRCQYTAMKLLYEHSFRNWLAVRRATELNGFIEKAIKRTTAAARDMNAKGDERRRHIIHAKAASLGKLGDGDTMQSFLSRLSAETASEMRVQRGYDSDPDRACEQAGYIDDLALDVIARAFDAYLHEQEFDFLREMPTAEPEACPIEPQGNLDELEAGDPAGAAVVDDWLCVLYFLIHLVPAGDIARLRHQMRKWEILAGKPEPESGEAHAPGSMLDRVQGIQKVFDLYLAMHDTKFEGNAALTGITDFKKFFQDGESFDRIFPRQPGGDDDDGRIPRRGLREIMRFGHLRPLENVFVQHRVTAKDVQGYEQADIARWQKEREELHEKWATSRKDFCASALEAYVRALAEIVRHRHSAARATLTDHVRVHGLLMTVLGRLMDFAGLWDRDLYFVTLALIHRNGSEPSAVFREKGCRTLSQGRIVEAIRNLNETAEAKSLRKGLQRYFGDDFLCGKASIRNRFAHFNMLRSGTSVSLTAEVNEARRLMAYDRKLKNAVSKSVIELLQREGLVLKWDMTPVDHSHQLGVARLETRRARHLGKTELYEKEASDRYPIEENLHGDGFVKMAAALFEPVTPAFENDVANLDCSKIDWNRSTRNRKERGSSKASSGRNKKGRSRARKP